MAVYYNEFKPEAAHMLRQLIKDGLIADGEVDERSIVDVRPEDLVGFSQCHFFAGLGGWGVAFRQAGWADDRPVWSGSAPCQPYSTAGKQKGKEDERDLWPVWSALVRECRPAVVFGEQVASAIPHGWLDRMRSDMEGQGYAVGAAVLPACSVNAPHKRDRLWFVGNRSGAVRQRDAGELSEKERGECGTGKQDGNLHQRPEYAGQGRACGVGQAASAGFPQRGGSQISESGSQQEPERRGEVGDGRVGSPTRKRCGEEGQYSSRSEERPAGSSNECARNGHMGNSEHDGRNGCQITGGDEASVQRCTQGQDCPCELEGTSASGALSAGIVANGQCQRQQGQGQMGESVYSAACGSGEANRTVHDSAGVWDSYQWLLCGDGKIRRVPSVESGICIVAHGVQHRAPLLHAFGNAIVSEVAARFIKAVM